MRKKYNELIWPENYLWLEEEEDIKKIGGHLPIVSAERKPKITLTRKAVTQTQDPKYDNDDTPPFNWRCLIRRRSKYYPKHQRRGLVENIIPKEIEEPTNTPIKSMTSKECIICSMTLNKANKKRCLQCDKAVICRKCSLRCPSCPCCREKDYGLPQPNDSEISKPFYKINDFFLDLYLEEMEALDNEDEQNQIDFKLTHHEIENLKEHENSLRNIRTTELDEQIANLFTDNVVVRISEILFESLRFKIFYNDEIFRLFGDKLPYFLYELLKYTQTYGDRIDDSFTFTLNQLMFRYLNCFLTDITDEYNQSKNYDEIYEIVIQYLKELSIENRTKLLYDDFSEFLRTKLTHSHDITESFIDY